MKYIEVETPYGLQKYPAYGIGGFVKDVFKGLKNVAKKIAPILPLALSFAPGFQALSPLTRGIISGLSSAAASKLTGADTDDAIRSGLLVGGTSMLPALFGGQKLTEGAKLRDVLSKDRGYLSGLFKGYQAPAPIDPYKGYPGGDAAKAANQATESLYSDIQSIGVPKGREEEFLTKFDAFKASKIGDPTMTAQDYYDTIYRKSIPLSDRALNFVKSPLGAATVTAAATPLIASAFEPKEETTTRDSRTGEDLIKEDYLKYIIQNLPGVTYNPEGGIDFGGSRTVSNRVNDSGFVDFMPKIDISGDEYRELMKSRTAAQGGIMSEAPKKYAMGSNPMNQFVPRNGLIPSMGEEGENGVSDNVKALLSPDEFVFTKQAVQAAGGGDVMAGAKKLMAQMKQLEARGAQMGIGKA